MKRIEIRGSIAPGHPALPGHFPGAPVVPGVLLLDEVLRAARGALGASDGFAALPWVKFHAPLRPGEEFVAEIEQLGTASFRFALRRGETLIASGKLSFGPEQPA